MAHREETTGEEEPAVTYTGPWPQNPADFDSFVTAFQDRLVRYACRRLMDFHAAEDVVQEVFVKAYTLREQLRHVNRPLPYLYRMTANVCTDRMRKRQPVLVHIDEVDHETTLPDGRASARDRAVAEEELRRADSLLGKLPPHQAEVVKLHLLDELTLGDIAQVQDCPLATVKSRFRYGIASLRRILTSGKERNS